MIEEDGPRRVGLQPCVELVVVLKIQVELSPVEVAAVNCSLFGYLRPVASRFQQIDHVIREVSFACRKRVAFDDSAASCGLGGLRHLSAVRRSQFLHRGRKDHLGRRRLFLSRCG